MQNKSVRAVLDRMQRVFGVKNDNQLGEALQVNRSTLGSWVARDSVPYAICVDIASERGISLDWLLTGEGAMHRGSGENYVANEPSNPREQAMLDLFRQLDEGGQRDIQGAAEEKKRLKSLEQRIQELEAIVAELKRLA